jgi:hypothetical protein
MTKLAETIQELVHERRSSQGGNAPGSPPGSHIHAAQQIQPPQPDEAVINHARRLSTGEQQALGLNLGELNTDHDIRLRNKHSGMREK